MEKRVDLGEIFISRLRELTHMAGPSQVFEE
jgi:hypothetical protein